MNGKRSVSNEMLEPEFGEAERHLPAFRRVGHNLCQYLLFEWTTSEIQRLQTDYTETLLLFITQLQGKGNITIHFVNC